MLQSRLHQIKSYIGLLLMCLILPAILFLFWDLSSQAREREYQQAKRSAAQLNRAIEEYRNYYASNILNRLEQEGMPPVTSSNYHEIEGALPVPATLTLEVAQNLSQSSGEMVKLYSEYPFVGSMVSDTELSALEQEAFTWLEENPGSVFEKQAEINGFDAAFFGHPVVMQADCVACHNTHPDSPKQDWEVGDLRGVLLISTTFTQNDGTFGSFLDTDSILVLILIGFLAILGVFLSGQTQVRSLQEQAEKLEELSNAKSDFLTNMSHELRTPMNGVIGMTSLLVESDLDEEQLDYVGTISRSSQHLLTVVNNILDFSKIDADKLDIDFDTVDLLRLLADISDLFAPQAAESQLFFKLDINPNVPKVIVGDANRLHQVFSNLLGNAIKFTPDGGVTLAVSVEETESGMASIRFDISDTGIGIPAEMTDTLFQPFHQADNSLTRRFGGTGLGLAISRELIQRMNGRIWFEPNGDKGTIFSFVLNEVEVIQAGFAAPTHAKQNVAENQAGPFHLTPARILYVEDNIVSQKIAERIFKRVGVQFDIVKDGQEALQKLSAETYTFIFTALLLPRITGIELIQRVQKQQPTFSYPTQIVVVSAELVPEFVTELESLGVSHFLKKPFKAADVTELIEHRSVVHD